MISVRVALNAEIKIKLTLCQCKVTLSIYYMIKKQEPVVKHYDKESATCCEALWS